MTTIHTQIPPAQVQILKYALGTLEASMKALKHSDSIDIQHLEHDIITLRAILDYDITVSMTEQQRNSFTAVNGVDFPIYTI